MVDVLQLEQVGFTYKDESKPILKNISLTIKKGSITTIIGLNGIGKSTLCYILSGIIPRKYEGKLTGKIELMGKNILTMSPEDISSQLGIVFQDPETQLFMPLVEDELAFAPENFCLSRKEIDTLITKSLSVVGMEAFRHHEINTLSGGQKQLIAIASVLTLNPKILIFDEVMSQIDEIGKKKIRNLILSLKKKGKTIIMVEHDFRNLDLADEIFELKDGCLNKINKNRE